MGLASEGKERPENNYGSREPEYSHQPAGPSAPSMELLHENFGCAGSCSRASENLQNIQRILKAYWASSLTFNYYCQAGSHCPWKEGI